MTRLRRKKHADFAPGGLGFAPGGAGYYYNYESDVSPTLIPGTGIKQFNDLDREENYWKTDEMYNDNQWRLQTDYGE